MEPMYHGGDKQSAIKRAKELGGTVIYSKAPRGASPELGYWSDERGGLIRSWEQEIDLETGEPT